MVVCWAAELQGWAAIAGTSENQLYITTIAGSTKSKATTCDEIPLQAFMRDTQDPAAFPAYLHICSLPWSANNDTTRKTTTSNHPTA
jgi:hypothetical protein